MVDPLLALFGNTSDEELVEDDEVDEFDKKTLLSTNDCLPPECDEGNIEYKLKLINPTQNRFEHLVTQMKWRLREGHGEAIYEIGVEDKGLLIGLSNEEVEASLKTLYSMAQKLGATITILRERIINDDSFSRRKAVEVLVRKVPDDQQTIELRIAVLGNVDVGKSTLLGVLTQGETDNGRGSARLNLFRHRHEIQSGRTSSISKEILGFDSNGSPITYNTCRTPEEIFESSSKLIIFIDLGGHQKYLKTTVFGLMAMHGDFALLVVSAICGVAGTTREHLGLALALGVPIIFVVNKIDLASHDCLKNTISQLETLLKSPICKKIPVRVKTEDDAITLASQINSTNVTPIFKISCITGEGLDLFYKFLNLLPPCMSLHEREKLVQMNSEFQVDETFQVPEVGPVVSGLLTHGIIKENDWFQIGPDDDGSFHPVQISSLQRHKVSCRVIRAGESATLALNKCNLANLRKGMVLRCSNEQSNNYPICTYFQARIHVLFHPKVIFPGFQCTVYIGNVRQTAIIIGMMGKKYISTNEDASVMFRFVKHPEYIHPGCRLLFREGPYKGIGHIIQVFPISGGLPLRYINRND